MYPPAPWRLQGPVLALAYFIERDAAEACVPDEVEVVSVLPGRTVGGLYAARYGAGSTLFYDELIVVPALVRCGGRIGAWISHIYVNHPGSLAGGRAIWSLPKVLAEFQWQERDDGTDLCVRVQRKEVCRLRVRQRLGMWTPPARFRFFSMREGEVMQSTVRVSADAALAQGHVEANVHSPFVDLDLRDTQFAVALRTMNATVYAPQHLDTSAAELDEPPSAA